MHARRAVAARAAAGRASRGAAGRAGHRGPRSAVLVAALCTTLATVAHARCDAPDPPDPAPAHDAAAAETSLQALVRAAIARSHAVGAARALAEATAREVDESRAAADPQASLSVSLGPSLAHRAGSDASRALSGGASVGVSQLLWDGGRLADTVDWRSQLAEAARLAQLSQQEQVVLASVALALDRNRYQAHERIYGQYLGKMQCLVESLQTIVAADRGRASELLQARKSLQQADLARQQAESRRRQTEIQLRRLVGEALPDTAALAAYWTTLPPLEPLLVEAERSVEMAQLGAQADAAARLVRVVAAGTRPQLSWTLNGSRDLSWGGGAPTQHASAVSVGLALSVPLWNPGVGAAVDAARLREQAAREQLAEALQARRTRVREVHEQARATADRAGRVQAILADSEQVRQATLLQWQQLGRRSLFDVMGAEAEHYNLRVSRIDAQVDGQQLGATLRSLGQGLAGQAGAGTARR